MTKRALLVGINEYEGAPLKGCVPDVQEAWDLLVEDHGFKADDVRLLLDGRATKAAIVERLKWLVGESKAGDTALFWFSGHGSQMRDRDGDELDDHKDELLVTADLRWWEGPLTDDTLRGLFEKQRKHVNLYVVLDCCHSGTGTRSIGPAPGIARRDKGDGTFEELPARYCPPPLDIWYREYQRELTTNRIGVKQKAKKLVPKDGSGTMRELVLDEKMRHVLIAGCKAEQTSADAQLGGGWRGAMSYYLQKWMMDRNLPLTEMIRSVEADLKAKGFSQNPQVEGQAALLGKPFLSEPER